MTGEPANDKGVNARWAFLRDAIVFQGKLVLDGMRDLILMPVTIGAAIADLVLGGEPGQRFYKVLRMARRSEEFIDLFGAAREPHERDARPRDASLDGFVARLESIITREYERGGVATTLKDKIDRAIDELQREADAGRQGARETAKSLAETIRARLEKGGGAKPPPDDPAI